MTERVSFFDRTKQFHRSTPRSWPASVKHIATVLFTYAGADDGGGITCSVPTICTQSGEPESNVQRAQKFLRDGGFMVDEGEVSPRKGVKIPARRLVLERMTEVRQAEDAAAERGPTSETGPSIGTGGVPALRPLPGPRNDTQTESKKDNREEVQPSTDSFALSAPEGPPQRGRLPAQPTNAKKVSTATKLTVSKAMEEYRPAFRIWYNRYPRHKSPEDALKAYAQAIVNHGVTPDTLLRSLNRQHAELLLREPEYRPYPASWLRDGSWRDEPDPPASTPGGGMVGGL